MPGAGLAHGDFIYGGRAVDLKVHHLRALVAVAQHGGWRPAARAVGLTQAALTKALRQLEQAAGYPLIVRGAQGIRITAEGAQLLVRARSISRHLERMEEELAQLRGSGAGGVRLALTSTTVLGRFGEVIQRFKTRFPAVEIRVAEAPAPVALQGVRSGSIDIAMLEDAGEIPFGEYRLHELPPLTRVLLVRAGHPVLRQPSLEAIARLEWLQNGDGGGLHIERLRAAFRLQGIEPPRRVVECDGLVAMRLLRCTDGVWITSDLAARELLHHGFVELPACGLHLSDARHFLAYRAGVPQTEPVAHMVGCLLAASGQVKEEDEARREQRDRRAG